MTVDPLLVQLIAGFVDEAAEASERATRAVLELERAGVDSATRAQHHEQLARDLHRLKGSSALLGLTSLAQLAHALEDLLGSGAASGERLSRSAADLVLSALDTFVSGVRSVAAGADPDGIDVRATLDAITALGAAPASALLAGVADAQPAHALAGDLDAVRDPERAPEMGTSWRVDAGQVRQLVRDVDRMRQVRLRIDERQRQLELVLAGLPELSATIETRGRLLAVHQGLRADALDAAETIATLEEDLKRICARKVATILEPLQRSLRDLCRRTDKQAALSVVGAEIALDRRLLEGLQAPLEQLLRNAIAHGIESPAERQRAGKHPDGSVTVRVEPAGNVVSISFEDDGAGFDIEAIRRAAVAHGLLDAARASAAVDRELADLVFAPGLTTRAEVSDTSGRGVGLDVVRSAVQALGGHIDVHTTLGQGTRFSLTVPMELGSLPVLVVRAGEQTFGLPLSSVESGIVLRREALVGARDTARVLHEGRLLPLRDLGVALGTRTTWTPAEGQSVLIVRSHADRVALTVDEVQDDLELVIRQLPAEVSDVAAFQGAALLALGDLLLVLQPRFLVDRAMQTDPQSHSLHALVVDDSLSARAIYRTVLEAGGVAVHAVGSAEQARAQAGQVAYDVILIDVMLGTDSGLDLVAQLRGQRATADVPILLISTLDDDDSRARGLGAGADAYLSKADCSSERLLQVVNAVVSRKRGAA